MRVHVIKKIVFFVLPLFMFCAILYYNCDTEPRPPGGDTNPTYSTVSIVRSSEANATDLDYNDILAMVTDAVGLAGGFDELIRDGDTVILKVNLVNDIDYTLPDWDGVPLNPEVNGCCTDYRVTRAVAELVRAENPSGLIYVLEGSSADTASCMANLNYNDVTIPDVDGFIILEDPAEEIVMVDLPDGLLHTSYKLNKTYKEADVVISIPCLKNHWNAVVSGAVKNVGIGAVATSPLGYDGVYRGAYIDHTSVDLHQWIRDYYLCRPVDYVIMDGLQGIQNGPTPSFMISGATNLADEQMNMRIILAGSDAIAVDTIESLIMNWDPFSVGYLNFLHEAGAGQQDPAHIVVKGKRIDEVRTDFEGELGVQSYGGATITDTTPPQMELQSYEKNGNTLTISLNTNSDLKKVEVYVNGVFMEPIILSGFSDFSINIGSAGSGPYEVELYGYDSYLSCTTLMFTVSIKGDYLVPKALNSPTIDGNGSDECWKYASWCPIDELWLGTEPSSSDFTARYKLSWDADYLYVLAEITDNVLSDTHADPVDNYYNDDCLELFIDEDKSGGDHTYTYNAFAYHMATDCMNKVDIHTDEAPHTYNSHINVAMATAGTTYTWEASVKIYDDTFIYGDDMTGRIFLTGNKAMGFSIAYCDNDGGGEREHFIGSVYIEGEDKNVSWQNADYFGSLLLVE